MREWPEKVLSVGFWGHQGHIKEEGEKAEREREDTVFLVLQFLS